MKFPSIKQIADDSVRTLRRFPFVLANAGTGVAAAIILVEREAAPEPTAALSILFAALLGIPLLTGLALLAEKRRWGNLPSLGLQIAAVLALGMYAWSLPANIAAAPALHAVRLAMLAVGLLLFIAIAPWMNRGQETGFWQFNKTLLLRALSAMLFTAVLYAGLALALAALENLFDIPIPGERYLELWIVLSGIFAKWFFLAGIPDDLDSLDASTDYPKALKIFAQYVLFPLMLIYLVIITAYSGKILVTWSWPNGWVSRLILGFASTGMLSLILLHPMRELAESKWIRIASRWFYVALAPFVLLYLLAVSQRLSDYGMTESRYIAIVIGVWLAGMVLYFLFSRGKNLKAIPLTLGIFALLITVGPWGAFSVSENSQVDRLRQLLEKNSILVDGKIVKSEGPVAFVDAKEISAALVYLHEMHGYGEIQQWFAGSLRQDSLGMQTEWKSPELITGELGVEFVAVMGSSSGSDRTFEASQKDAMIIAGYDRAFPAKYFADGGADWTMASGEATYSLNPSLDTLTFVLTQPGQAVETVVVPLASVSDSLSRKYHESSASEIPIESTAIEISSDRLRIKVYCLMLRQQREADRWNTTTLRVQVLYGIVHPKVEP
ncbi:MAG: DUF4153 domain-containing protein [Bacteroidota bacterium]